MNQVQALLQSHPHWAAVQTIYHRLISHGYKAFLAGGCVRDALLGVQAHDLDIATNATPDEIEALFEKTVNVGKSFGVMRVLVNGADLEVATFRNDGSYVDGRRPDSVTFSSPKEDAQRRDFTINALFYDLQAHQVLDFVEGQKDLQVQILRTVGEARQRFREDHLRLLRGARFAGQLGFALDPQTLQAMTELAPLVKTVSGERIRDELGKLLRSAQPALGLKVMEQTGLLRELFPWRSAEWKGPAHSEELWKNLSLFFRSASKEDLNRGLELLKLSVKERRAIEEAWGLWQHPESLWQSRLGIQLQSLQKAGVRWGLEVLLRENRFKSEIESLFADELRWGGALPKAFLNGDDLKGRLHGENIGRCLQEAYCLQLERQLSSRDEALTWLPSYLQQLQQPG